MLIIRINLLVVIKDSWRTYATYVYSDSLTTEMIKNTLLRVPNTIKEAVKIMLLCYDTY